MRARFRFPDIVFASTLLLAFPSTSHSQVDTGTGDDDDIGFSSGSLAEHGFASLEAKIAPEGMRGFVSRTPSSLELSKQSAFTPKALPTLRSNSPRYGTLRLGRGGKTQVILDQSDPQSGIYDLLYVDRNRDTDLSNDGEAHRAKIGRDDQRGLPYVEFTNVPFPVYYSQGLELEHRFTFYYWKRTESDFDRIAYIASSWREGIVKLENAEAKVFCYDEDGDAMYVIPNVRWALVPKDANSDALPELISSELPIRFNGKPWKLSTLMPEGQRVELEIETEARAQRIVLEVDPTATEPPRARAGAPLAFSNDLEATKAAATKDRKPLFILFDAPWSQSGQLLRERTLMDAEVQQLVTEKFAPVAIDYDRDRLTAARYDVTAVPTVLIVDAKGVVTDRVVGYRQARNFADLLRTWRP